VFPQNSGRTGEAHPQGWGFHGAFVDRGGKADGFTTASRVKRNKKKKTERLEEKRANAEGRGWPKGGGGEVNKVA